MLYKIFYSWQSELPNSTNRGFIQDVLDGVAKDITGDDTAAIETVVDRDTSGVPGAPDIGRTIFEKIDSAAVFVCDVSLVTLAECEHGRRVPNANVMIELGYALKSLGESRVIFVMNTALGGPESLPFDLRQKRITTYKLEQGASKADVRKELAAKLGEGVRAILKKHHADSSAAAEAGSVTAAVAHILGGSPETRKDVAKFMDDFASKVDAMAPKLLEREQMEDFPQAVEATAPLLKDFGRISEAVAMAPSIDAARALMRGFEPVLSKYFRPADLAGRHGEYDQDLMKFVGHEAMVIFVAHLIREGRWGWIHELLKTPLVIPNLPNRGKGTVNFVTLSSYANILDGVLGKERNRMSLQADILKARHDVGGVLYDTATWDEFMEADYFILLWASKHAPVEWRRWWPRSAVYMSRHAPRYLIDAASEAGSRNLALALGATDANELRSIVIDGHQKLVGGVTRMNMLADTFGFDSTAIADY